MSSEDKNRITTIAIADELGKWQYYSFSTWDEAREAVNQARREGKAAVFYDGSPLAEPPNFSTSSQKRLD